MGVDTGNPVCASPGTKVDTSVSKDSVGIKTEASRVLAVLSMVPVTLLSISGKVAEADRVDSVGAVGEPVRAAVAPVTIVSISVGSPLKISETLLVN